MGVHLKLNPIWRLPGVIAAAAALSLALAASAAAAPKVTSKTVYFTVSGSTPAALLRDILRKGSVGRVRSAMATTQANISQSLKPRGKRGCRYSSKAVITMRLPRLAKSSRRSRSVRRVWKSFSRYIRAHENQHRSIYTSCARRIDRKARAYIRKHGCKGARVKITEIMVDERLRCKRLNQRYDLRERKRIRRLPLIRQATVRRRG